jgi:hypothetical protein
MNTQTTNKKGHFVHETAKIDSGTDATIYTRLKQLQVPIAIENVTVLSKEERIKQHRLHDRGLKSSLMQQWSPDTIRPSLLTECTSLKSGVFF